MAALTKQSVPLSGLADLTYASCAGGGDTVANPNRGDVILFVNGDASAKTITIAVPGTEWNGGAKADTALTVEAGDTGVLLLDPRYGDSGVANITYSAVTSCTIAVFTA